jgi:hypothetical protein
VPPLADPYIAVIGTSMAADLRPRTLVIQERLVADYGFTEYYQRVRVYVAPRPSQAPRCK